MEEIMGGNISGNGYLATYQNFDGSNTTLVVTSIEKKNNKFTCSAGMGLGTNFQDKVEFITEGKASYSLNDNLAFKARLRNRHSEGSNTSQLRFSPEVKAKLGKNTTAYGDVYVAPKISYETGKITTDYGAFAGVSQNLGHGTTLSCEIQRYKADWGINAILGWSF
jgi:hypothetical protein